MNQPIILDGKVVAVAVGPDYDPRRRVVVKVASGSKHCFSDVQIVDDTLQLGDDVELVLERRSVPAVGSTKV